MKWMCGPRTAPTWHVAPHWGAWIEISSLIFGTVQIVVAPHWGAWIEIFDTETLVSEK